MKILFVAQHHGYLRHYEAVIRDLSSRGHQVHIAMTPGLDTTVPEAAITRRLTKNCAGVTSGEAVMRSRPWRGLAAAVRSAMDILRYNDVRYAEASELRARVSVKSGIPFARLFAWLVKCGGPCVGAFVMNLLRDCEKLIPSSPEIEDFMRAQKAEVVLITPLINFASWQEDYVKSARALKIPSALCVASWDNLTNKGLIRQPLDAVLVWNDAQKKEAVEMHGVPEDHVVVTGAQSYDRWFGRAPHNSREDFCQRVGLDPLRPMILYLCSSPFIARGGMEATFVQEWLKAVGADDVLGTCSVLIRPHPQNAAIWKGVEFGETAALYPREGANPIETESEADFFDSLYHSTMVVGLNTSGMIEAGIVGRPVFTILDPRFTGTQTGTLHFHHLVDGGLVRVARRMDEHLQHLREVLLAKSDWEARTRAFVQSFIRPCGMDKPAANHVVAAVESLSLKVVFDRKPACLSRMVLWALRAVFFLMHRMRP